MCVCVYAHMRIRRHVIGKFGERADRELGEKDDTYILGSDKDYYEAVHRKVDCIS